jgi:hypothetical protein
LKDFRRIATRYDKLALNYLASVYLAAALVWWILRERFSKKKSGAKTPL